MDTSEAVVRAFWPEPSHQAPDWRAQLVEAIDDG